MHYLLFSEQLPKNFRGSCSACTITSWGWSSYTEIWWDGWTNYWGRSVLSNMYYIHKCFMWLVVKKIMSYYFGRLFNCRNRFYEVFYSAFDDQSAAMNSILKGKELFTQQVIEELCSSFIFWNSLFLHIYPSGVCT